MSDADWPNHKRRCGGPLYEAEIAEEREEIEALGNTTTLPLHALQAVLNDWIFQYRPLLLLSVLHAQGLWDRPPAEHPTFATPQVFYTKLSASPGLSPRTKARAAFRVENAEIFPVSELRVAAVDTTHRLYNIDMAAIVADFDQHVADRISSGPGLMSNYRITMVVHSITFRNGFGAMSYLRNWYFEGDQRTDYSQQWRPLAGDWLGFLKETVAAGKGWNRNDINFL
ncbi:hypothetical protein C8R43DRAFT_1135040 [Mycena crocata]|nr:hypothetical protein C8R43DRAFT_1135040 [Mycena crocata]